MIEIYDVGNTNYDWNGDITIDSIVEECKITCEDINSIPVLTLEALVDDSTEYKSAYVEEMAVIKCKAPWSKEKQLFRISKIEKDLDSIIATAYPVFFDSVKTYVKDIKNEDVMIVDTGDCNGQEALNKILANTKYKGHSNISKVRRARYDKKNIVQALNGDIDNSFTRVWGGEIYLNNYDVYINESIGHDNGVTIEYGKNLTGLKEEVDMSGVVTRIIPIGFNGLRLEGKTPWIDSENINKYYDIFEKEIVFEDIKVKDENDEEGFNTIEEARAELIRRAKLMFTEEHIDVPLVALNIEFVDLSKTLEYKDVPILEEINQGDIVRARHSKLGVDTNIRCIGYDYNVVTESYNSLKLGQATYDYFKNENDKWNNMNNRIDNILNDVDGKFDNITDKDGNLLAEKVKGFLDATKTKLKAQRQIGQLQDQRAFIWEDLDPNSLSYGCMVGGSAGIQISQQRTPDGRDWDFTSAFTAEGIIADKIVGNLFSSKDGSTTINMNNGEFKSKQPDGSMVIISPKDGFYNKFGGSKREYHHLSYDTDITAYTDERSMFETSVKLPDEFKGKDFQINLNFKNISSATDNPIFITHNQVVYYKDKNILDGTFNVRGQLYANGVYYKNLAGAGEELQLAYILKQESIKLEITIHVNVTA